LAAVDADAVAEAIEWALRGVEPDQLAYRSGPVRGRGYVHEHEAAQEILEELLQPELHDLTRRAAQGLHSPARQMAFGLFAVSPTASATSRMAPSSPTPVPT
jgi:hypothetical protein